MRRRTVVVVVMAVQAAFAQPPVDTRLPLRADGTIPVWLVAGPFEQKTVGFGEWADTDMIGEQTSDPDEGRRERSSMVLGDSVTWLPQSVSPQGYLDLNATIGWAIPAKVPEKLFAAKAAYAFCSLESQTERSAIILLGSNAQLRVFLNGTLVHKADAARDASRDDDSVRVNLRQGRNTLLLKVGNSHLNYWFRFFGGAGWGWGAYVRLVDSEGKPVPDITEAVAVRDGAPSASLVSTFFFTRTRDTLEQRFDAVVLSRSPEPQEGRLRLFDGVNEHLFPLPGVGYGLNRFPISLPAVTRKTPVRAELTISGTTSTSVDTLHPEQRYELHLMFLAHQDIGYTHPQPVVKELHLRTLDQVLQMCEEFPEFRWTIETVWMVRQYELGRPRESFEKLMGYIQEGRIAVSPLFTNPFTGWVSEEEMMRSVDAARDYARRYGIRYPGAIFNDTPGLSWFVPRVLMETGTSMLVCGLNEVYNDYAFQRTLPKAFLWNGAGGSSIVTYRTETYNEGTTYGLERDSLGIAYRIWERLHKLRAAGYASDVVLLNAGFGDNGPVPRHQFIAAKQWNERHAYPRFVFTNLAEFADRFPERQKASLPEVRGDWTSTWDILYQGEPARMIRIRSAQRQLLAAEKIATITALEDRTQVGLNRDIGEAYEALLHFTGHGSGLEYGYGTPGENRLTMEYREQYVREASLGSREILERALTRLVRPQEDFAAPGGLVFNPLSWTWDAPLAVELRDSSSAQMAVTDLSTGGTIPCFRDGYWIYLVAPALPPVGFKKLKAEQSPASPAKKDVELAVGDGFIENRFYKIVVDRSRARIASVVHKQAHRELVKRTSPFPFAGLVRQRAFAGEEWTPVAVSGARVTIMDQRPARVLIRIDAPGTLLERSDIVLWNGLNRVEFNYSVNLEALTETASTEEYSIAYPVALERPHMRGEVLGGMLDPSKDRFPGVQYDGFSLRNALALSDQQTTVSVASPDCRVVFFRDDADSVSTVLLANIVNNFPRAWNRNEENKGQLTFRFSITATVGAFDPVKTARFGWEASTEIPVRSTWLRVEPTQRSYFSVDDGPVMLTALASTGEDGFFLRLSNCDITRRVTATVRSRFFKNTRAWKDRGIGGDREEIAVQDTTLSLPVEAGEICTVLIR